MIHAPRLQRAAVRMIVATISAITVGLVGVPWAVTGLQLAPAAAVTPTPDAVVNCPADDLQAAINDVNNSVIEINGICTDAYQVPAGKTLTLQGNPSTSTANPDGFDRGGNAPRALSGQDVGLTLTGLVFKNSRSATFGGAIALTGTIGANFDELTFTNNVALAGDGGAVSLTRTPLFKLATAQKPKLPSGPAQIAITNSVFGSGGMLTNTARAGNGGAVFISTPDQDVSFATNSFTGNIAERNGGAVFVDSANGTTLSKNDFTNNNARSDSGSATPLGGGGAYITASSGGPSDAVHVADNNFGNNIARMSGGGLLVDALTTTISANTFTGNTLTGTISSPFGENTAAGGGGFRVKGSVLDVFDNTVRNNKANRQPIPDNTEPTNTFGEAPPNGGGAAIQTRNATDTLNLHSNVFSGNVTSTGGGGAWVNLASNSHADIADNTFESNRLTTCPAIVFSVRAPVSGIYANMDHRGGGLALTAPSETDGPDGFTGATASQQRNRFTANAMEAPAVKCGDPETSSRSDFGDLVGAGEYLLGVDTTSLDDQFINNTIANASPVSTDVGEVQGAGLGIEGSVNFYGENLVSAGNKITDGHLPDPNSEQIQGGGGIYVGYGGARVDLVNSTVSGNSVMSPNIGPGIAGESEATLFLTNTIVAGNSVGVPGSTPRPDIDGFTPSNTTTVFTDSCRGSGFSGGPYVGDGNICADPLLVDAANGDVHQTPSSPTRDLGSSPLVPPGLTTDYEGDARISDGRVDMGADERARVANLTTSKTVSPTSVKVGENLTYVVTTTNHGPDAASSVTIVDNLPASVGFVSATPSSGGTCGTVPAAGASGTVSCTWSADTAANSDRVLTIVVTAKSTGNVLNTATASSGTPDPTPDNNSGSAVAVLGTSELRAGDGITPPGSIGLGDGYCMLGEDGGVFTFGGCKFVGAAAQGPIIAPSTGKVLNAPMVGFAMTPDNNGYWIAAADGGVFAKGTAGFYGSMGGTKLNHPIVGISSSAGGKGYYLVASDGGVFTFGDAKYYGSRGGEKLNKPIVNIVATPSGLGYWLVASDGGIFTYGDAKFFGSTGGMKLNADVVGMGSRPGGLGYWLVATDGGVFTFGDAPFLGSQGATKLNKPIMAMKPTSTGIGYYMVANDGGIFTFGDALFLGSMGGTKLNQPIVDMTG